MRESIQERCIKNDLTNDKKFNYMISIKTIKNAHEGNLSFFEAEKDIPFMIKRVYYTYGVTANVKRGMHAHKLLQQALWCPYGTIEVILDDGKNKVKYMLDDPSKVLVITKGYWRDIYWRKEGSVLCVAASDYYNESDYIRDYDEFLKYAKEKYWENEN